MIIDKRDYNGKRIYECKICHKENRNSYICADCKSLFSGLPRKLAPKRDANGKRMPKLCIDCNGVIMSKGTRATRCRDCLILTHRLRNDIRNRLEINRRKMTQIMLSREDTIGKSRRYENLQLSQVSLLQRLEATYKHKKPNK